MTDWVYGIDVSYDQLSDAEVAKLKVAGVRVAVQCLWTGAEQPAVRVSNLRTALNGGLTIAGYASIGSTGDGAAHMQHARDGVPDDLWAALQQCFVDVELPGNNIGQAQAAVDKIATLGKPKAIYTSYQQWHNVMGNPTRPAGATLWNAFWDADPDADFGRLPFGGWSVDEVIAEQWSGGTNVQGVNADRDQFRADAFGLIAPPKPVTPVPTPPPAPDDAAWLRAAAIMDEIALGFTNRKRPTDAQKELAKFVLDA